MGCVIPRLMYDATYDVPHNVHMMYDTTYDVSHNVHMLYDTPQFVTGGMGRMRLLNTLGTETHQLGLNPRVGCRTHPHSHLE